MHNPVSKYLNTIGAVPHDRTLGLILLWLALGLTVLEGVLFGLAAVRKLIVPPARPEARRARWSAPPRLRMADVDIMVVLALVDCRTRSLTGWPPSTSCRTTTPQGSS